MSDLRETLLKTAFSFLENHDKFTADSVIAHRSPTCTHTLKPSTIPIGTRSNAEYSAFVAQCKAVMHNWKFQIVPGTEPAADTVTRQVTLQLTSKSDTDIGVYANEYIWILGFNEDGTEITKIVEFADSAYTLDMVPKLTEAMKRKGEASTT